MINALKERQTRQTRHDLPVNHTHHHLNTRFVTTQFSRRQCDVTCEWVTVRSRLMNQNFRPVTNRLIGLNSGPCGGGSVFFEGMLLTADWKSTNPIRKRWAFAIMWLITTFTTDKPFSSWASYHWCATMPTAHCIFLSFLNGTRSIVIPSELVSVGKPFRVAFRIAQYLV